MAQQMTLVAKREVKSSSQKFLPEIMRLLSQIGFFPRSSAFLSEPPGWLSFLDFFLLFCLFECYWTGFGSIFVKISYAL
jgi:hypothetical protein